MLDPLPVILAVNRTALQAKPGHTRALETLRMLCEQCGAHAAGYWRRLELSNSLIVFDPHAKWQQDEYSDTLRQVAKQSHQATCVRHPSFPDRTLAIVPVENAESKVTSAAQAVLLLEFHQPVSAQDQIVLLRILQACAHWLAHDTNALSTSPSLALQRALLQPIDLKTTAMAIANEGLCFTQADRISLFRFDYYRRKCTLLAVSGQAVIDSHALVIKSLSHLAQTILVEDRPWTYPSHDPLAPPQEHAVEQYLDHSPTKSMVAMPLRANLIHSLDSDGKDSKVATERIMGVLVAESFTEHDSSNYGKRLEDFALLAEPAFEHAVTRESIWLYPLWHRLSLLRTHWFKACLTISALVAIVLLLGVMQAPVRIEAKGTLQPVKRANVYSRVDGTIREIHIQPGAHVNVGDPLLTLESPEIEKRHHELLGQLASIDQRLVDLKGLRLNRSPRTNIEPSSEPQYAAEEQQLMSQRKTLFELRELIEQDLAALVIKSEISGQILTWDLERKLAGRPINRGQELLTLADTDSSWQLELHVPDQQAGPLLEALQHSTTTQIKVDYYLANEPEVRRQGQLTWVSNSAEVLGSENGVQVKVAIDLPTDAHAVAGTSVTARLRCDSRPLGYVWFRDVFAFVYRNLVFRWTW